MPEKTFDHRDAHKLDNPQRLQWLPPDAVISALRLAPGMRVADIGAGSGYFTLPIARKVGPHGKVFAVDLQPEMLSLLAKRVAAEHDIGNVEMIEADAGDTRLPAKSCDLVLMAAVWHEIEDHMQVLREVARVLRGGGSLVILDWRADVDRPPGPPLDHRIPPDRVMQTLEAGGWATGLPQTIGPYSYLIIAKRSAPDRAQ
jgi:ubiquinone/menaquinone biosynthesis C-methylase UbiE